MSGVSLNVDAQGLQEIGKTIQQMAARVSDMTPFFETVGASLVASTLDRFEKSQAPSGDGWLPSRRGGKTLVKSGRLRALITYAAGPAQVSVGTNVVYAAVHQFGGAAGRGKKTILPARPFIGLSADDIKEIELLAQDHLEGKLA